MNSQTIAALAFRMVALYIGVSGFLEAAQSITQVQLTQLQYQSQGVTSAFNSRINGDIILLNSIVFLLTVGAAVLLWKKADWLTHRMGIEKSHNAPKVSLSHITVLSAALQIFGLYLLLTATHILMSYIPMFTTEFDYQSQLGTFFYLLISPLIEIIFGLALLLRADSLAKLLTRIKK